MKSQPDEKEAERAVAGLIETYRQGFLRLDPEQIASIWDTRHEPLIYVAQEMKEPTYGWSAIHRYIAALPEHLEKVLAKEVKDLKIDILGDTAIAFFISHSRVKLKARDELHEPAFRVSMIFKRTQAGWRAIHFHESALSAQAAQAMASARVAHEHTSPRTPGALASTFEELNRALVFLGRCARLEGAKIAPPLCPRVKLARIQTVLSGFELSDHGKWRAIVVPALQARAQSPAGEPGTSAPNLFVDARRIHDA